MQVVRPVWLVVLVATGLLAVSAPVHSQIVGVQVVARDGLVRSLAPGGSGPADVTSPPSAEAGHVAFVDRDHRFAVSQQVAISGDGRVGMASWWLNDERVARYDPAAGRVWEHPGVPYGLHHSVATDAAATVAAAGVRPAVPLDTVHDLAGWMQVVGWSGAEGPEPAHTFVQQSSRLCSGMLGSGCSVRLHASAAGDLAVATHQTRTEPGDRGEVVLYDTDLEPRWAAPFSDDMNADAIPWRILVGVTLSADGSTLAVTTYNTTFVFRPPALDPVAVVHGFSEAPASLSSDGTLLALGGFASHARLFAWDGAGYGLRWARDVGHPWVTSVAVADDGTVLAGTYDYRDGDAGKVVALAPEDGTALWECLCYGDYVAEVVVTPDGSRAAAVSWGAPGADALTVFAVPSGDVLFRLVHGVDEPGSLFSVAISDDGTRVLAGGKAVHARQWGNGGQVYGIAVPREGS